MEELTEISLRERIRLNLVFAMERANINQVNLADKLGISKGTVNNWVRGNNSPDVDMVPKICKVLKITIKDFYSDSIATSYGAQDANSIKNAPPYSEEALKLAGDYDGLDGHGKRIIRLVADEELARCTQPAQVEKPEPEAVYFIVPMFLAAMSAGTGQPAGSDEPEELELSKRPPRGTSYVAHISGDSMEPTYHDGDKLFIRSCKEIEIGQIGIFLMDGQQWVKERGDGVLISHNQKYDPIPMREDIKCQGLVLGVCDASYFE
ncbi:XRE family transcriptional regulator [Pseudoflavonifractor sp. 60]|uniref:XRE family transcriptional regulator n=1 Tax=Pseudoflavonifractor sp. 60 TaxID=2304576 RepID=UPI00136E1DFF|nr:XRE family transcriptional regulator [Pseudoflavonifractor sp. 60]